MMLKSIISGKSRKRSSLVTEYIPGQNSLAEEEPQKLYIDSLKSISGDWLRFLREVLGLWGKMILK